MGGFGDYFLCESHFLNVNSCRHSFFIEIEKETSAMNLRLVSIECVCNMTCIHQTEIGNGIMLRTNKNRLTNQFTISMKGEHRADRTKKGTNIYIKFYAHCSRASEFIISIVNKIKLISLNMRNVNIKCKHRPASMYIFFLFASSEVDWEMVESELLNLK